MLLSVQRIFVAHATSSVSTAQPCFQLVCCAAAGEIECGRPVVQDVVAALAGDIDDGVASRCTAVENDDVLADAQGRQGVAGPVCAIEHIVYRGVRMGGAGLAHQLAPEGASREQGGAARREQRDRQTWGERAMDIHQAVDDHRGMKLEHA